MLLIGDCERGVRPSGKGPGSSCNPTAAFRWGGGSVLGILRHRAGYCGRLLGLSPVFSPPHPCCSVSIAIQGSWQLPVWFIKCRLNAHCGLGTVVGGEGEGQE